MNDEEQTPSWRSRFVSRPPGRKPVSGAPRVYRVPPGPAVEILVVSQEITWALTHHVDGRDMPCVESFGELCPVRSGGVHTPRRTGWLVGFRPGHRSLSLVAVTEGAWANCPELARLDGQLRGKILSLVRLGDRRESPVRVKVVRTDDRPLPEPPDVAMLLCKLWRLDLPPEEQP